MAGLSGGTPEAGTTGVPLGTVVPDSPLSNTSDIFLTYRNFGDVDLWGADVAIDYLFNDKWSVAGSFSWVSDDFFAAADVGGPTDIALNASKAKGSFTTRFRDELAGWSGEIRGRYVKGFPVTSGVYVSPVRPDGTLKPLDSYGLLDAQVAWRPRFAPGAVFSIIVENALNENYSTFVGVPQLGRLVMTKLQYAF
jgi:iron complex outermembrane receptor protein